jgi:hypothetical protein
VELGVEDADPNLTSKQSQSNPKVEDGASPQMARIEPRKDVKEEREKDVYVHVERFCRKVAFSRVLASVSH